MTSSTATASARSALDAAAAVDIASAAGSLLVGLRVELAERGLPRGKRAGDVGDARSQDLIARLLAEHHPDDAVLSEESADDPRRARAERVWIIDPLDGSREYGEGTRVDWAVHVALWQRGSLVAGAVGLPALDSVVSTDNVPHVLPPLAGMPPRLAVSRSRPPAITEPVRAALGADLVPMGSAGFKVMAVVLGMADAYVHAEGQYEWDSAAPVAVAHAAGLHTSRLDGSPLRYNQPDPWLPDLIVCRPELAPLVLEVTAR